MGVQHCGNSVLISAEGELDEDAGGVRLQALDHVTTDDRDLLVDLHGVTPWTPAACSTSWTSTGTRNSCA
ncbi:hypothetical protein OG594_24045 [Streptomyces sp. NBC_01214]|uniref:hypothetical protein n=1 Tax=Streptomyces sp. NBC_01214 TaxID=2903777 RepID=UPI0022551CB4|nr:hypothetical protein [Streptomyces sp. NBC_01214]MCX4804652.1 hypothetical protein [Streptomyces sp. NBC_01214]